MKKFVQLGLSYPLGCIIAKATLTDCVKVDEDLKKELRRKNALVYSGTTENLDWEGYGFQLANIQPIEPIFVNGKLGLWEYGFVELPTKQELYYEKSNTISEK